MLFIFSTPVLVNMWKPKGPGKSTYPLSANANVLPSTFRSFCPNIYVRGGGTFHPNMYVSVVPAGIGGGGLPKVAESTLSLAESGYVNLPGAEA